jgi:hypothetical protein
MIEIIKSCAVIISVFSKKKFLTEYELFAYEQACRTMESVLRKFNECTNSKGKGT